MRATDPGKTADSSPQQPLRALIAGLEEPEARLMGEWKEHEADG
jgi:hypothetical protein